MKDKLAKNVAEAGDDDAIRGLLEQVCALTGMGFSAVAFVSADRWIVCQVDDRIDFGLDPGAELEVRKTICDEIRDHGRAVMIDDTEADRDWWNHPVPVLYGFRSYVSIPITLGDGSFFGTLCAIDPEPRTQSIADQLDDLHGLANEAARILTERFRQASATV